MKSAIRTSADLCAALDLPATIVSTAGAEEFPVFAPLGFVARMRVGDPRDPLLLQVLPAIDEDYISPDFTNDPVGDEAATLTPGLIQKYQGRALLITTGACAIHCRYCFRRHFPYSAAPTGLAQWRPALERLADDDSIEEVLLSGGDPLTLTDNQLADLVHALADIPHLRRLRLHTRLPIVIPSRVTSGLLDLIRGVRLTSIMVVHANHPHEIDQEVHDSLGRLVDAGIVTLNQSVLLRGVNDSVAALAGLSERLIDARVMPYYLHQLDRVRGAAHFEVPQEQGLALIQAMRKQLPGYAVPRYVRETAGGLHKEVLG